MWYSINTIYIIYFPSIHDQIIKWHTINRYAFSLSCITYSKLWVWDYSYKMIMNPKRLTFSKPLFWLLHYQTTRIMILLIFCQLIPCKDPQDFKDLNLSTFLCMPIKRIYPSLVNIFSPNFISLMEYLEVK